MAEYLLAFKPATGLYGQHDPSAVLFEDGELVFGVEEERFSREKHAPSTFPGQAIEACLEYRDLELSDVDRVVLPYDPPLQSRIVAYDLRDALGADGVFGKLNHLEQTVRRQLTAQLFPETRVRSELAKIGTPLPPIERRSHHACHAASAFHPSGFERAVVVTADAKGEYDSTVVWRGTPDGLERVRTYEHPNSLGLFYAIVTEYLGYRMFNGEGKVMGLAAYGDRDPDIEAALRDVIETGIDYDVTRLTRRWGTEHGITVLEELFDRPGRDEPGEFTEWEKNFAHTAQVLLEETVLSIIERYAEQFGFEDVALAGGVALNCTLNASIRASPAVDRVFIQPVAHDAGLAVGAGYLDQPPDAVDPMESVYWGPEYTTDSIVSELEKNKIGHERPDDLTNYVAGRIAEGALVGWFQGRLEMGPRALGNRSILADPRTEESRDRINAFVKHREGWRPFAPSMLEEAAAEYLCDYVSDPYMITTFSVREERADEIAAVLHPANGTTRPQTVRRDQNPRYYRLLTAFAEETGVPVLLNTSFNDNGEPIVRTPTEAIKDFFGMGLDLLVLDDVIVEKKHQTRSLREMDPLDEPQPDWRVRES